MRSTLKFFLPALLVLNFTSYCTPFSKELVEKNSYFNPNDTVSLIRFDKPAPIESAPSLILNKKKKLSRKERTLLKKEFRKLTKLTIKKMSDNQLRKAADICINLEWYEQGLLYLKRLGKTTQSVNIAKATKLEIADIAFLQGHLKTAATLYDEYINLYPGDKEKTSYAYYKGILSNFYSICEKDRDQTKTNKTIALANMFSKNESSYFKKYKQDVEIIKHHCFVRLYEHDMEVFNYYLKRDSFKSAEVRLASMKKLHTPKLPEVESQLLYCDYRIALAKNDAPRLKKISQELANRFPEQSERFARSKPVKSFSLRF